MQREGSPFAGMSAVALKEAADHLSSARMHLVMLLIVLTAVGAIYGAIGQIRQDVGEDQFLFLRLFTSAPDRWPAFVSILGFLLPLVAIALAFDGVNGEHGRRTLSRVLAQPIYRDALLAGKLVGGLIVLAICLVSLWLMVTGLGIVLLGVPPGGEEILRGLAYLLCSLAYGGVWLAVALFFSTIFRAPATSALAALTLWLLFAVFWTMLAVLIAGLLAPLDPLEPVTAVSQAGWQQGLARLSPNTLYGEMTLALLNPATRSIGLVFMSQLQGAVMGTPLPFTQSALLVWPHLTGLIAATILIFTLAYVAFQRQEIRA
jgi:ABC-2 type transport system permease protein